MRCASCDHRYSVAWAQPSPGGSSAPGAILAVGALTAVMAAAAFATGSTAWGVAGVLITAFVGLQLFVAWGDCRRSGGKCPRCGSANPVRPWST